MKKIALLVTLLMIMAVSACGDEKSEEVSTTVVPIDLPGVTPTSTTTTVVTPVETTTTTIVPEPQEPPTFEAPLTAQRKQELEQELSDIQSELNTSENTKYNDRNIFFVTKAVLDEYSAQNVYVVSFNIIFVATTGEMTLVENPTLEQQAERNALLMTVDAGFLQLIQQTVARVVNEEEQVVAFTVQFENPHGIVLFMGLSSDQVKELTDSNATPEDWLEALYESSEQLTLVSASQMANIDSMDSFIVFFQQMYPNEFAEVVRQWQAAQAAAQTP